MGFLSCTDHLLFEVLDWLCHSFMIYNMAMLASILQIILLIAVALRLQIIYAFLALTFYSKHMSFVFCINVYNLVVAFQVNRTTQKMKLTKAKTIWFKNPLKRQDLVLNKNSYWKCQVTFLTSGNVVQILTKKNQKVQYTYLF